MRERTDKRDDRREEIVGRESMIDKRRQTTRERDREGLIRVWWQR